MLLETSWGAVPQGRRHGSPPVVGSSSCAGPPTPARFTTNASVSSGLTAPAAGPSRSEDRWRRARGGPTLVWMVRRLTELTSLAPS
jgi:hypothetical protein